MSVFEQEQPSDDWPIHSGKSDSRFTNERELIAEAARLVRDMRRELGVTQEQLGERCGLNARTIGKIETASAPKPPALETLVRIAAAGSRKLKLVLEPTTK
jgi:DNA-binding XRE family transcriptional regulator